MIKRFYSNLDDYIVAGKVLVIYGPRRIGKTTLLKDYLVRTNFKYKLDSGDNIRTQQILGSQDFKFIMRYVEGYDLLVIDEAQQIPNIGMGLKIIVDQRPDIRIIATGSSSFDLANNIGEPLTGRKRTLTLYPIAQMELLNIYNRFELQENLAEYLIYGSYPEIINAKTKNEKNILLEELVDSYLLKDILSLERVKSPKFLLDLLKLLAFQIGNEVSLTELSRQLKIDVKTVGRYLDLLEKTFVIYSLSGFSRNLRSEVTRKNKYYFFDNGVRNAVIAQFNPINLRDDLGKLWENFLMVERRKKKAYLNIFGSSYFWRTYEQQEIDLIEDREGKLFAYEFKWKDKKIKKASSLFSSTYKNTEFLVVDQNNYQDFIV